MAIIGLCRHRESTEFATVVLKSALAAAHRVAISILLSEIRLQRTMSYTEAQCSGKISHNRHSSCTVMLSAVGEQSHIS